MMPSRLANRAQLAAQLQYAPQQSALAALLQQAYGDYDVGVRASESAATGVARSAKRAIGPSRREFRSVQRRTAERRRQAVSNIAELGDAADPYKASFTSESALASQLARQEQRGHVNELRDRAVSARQGAAFDARALRAELQGNVMDIAGQMQTLSGQEGASAANIYQDLLDQAGDRRLEHGRLRETQRHNRASEDIANRREQRQAAEDRRGAKGRGRSWLTPSQQNEQFDSLEQARSFIRQMDNGKRGSGRIRQALLNGVDVPAQPVYDEQGRRVLNPDGTQKTTPAIEIPAFDKDLINAAFDLHELGYLSRPNVDALHRRGLKIRGRYRYARPDRGKVGDAISEAAPRGIGGW